MKVRHAAPLLAIALWLLPATLAHASTEAQRFRWAQTPPEIFSHGEQSRHVCFAGAFVRNDDGSTAILDGTPCTDQYAPIPVHRGGKVVVVTPRSARAVTLSIDRGSSGSGPGPSPRACVERAPGRWRCRTPPPGAAINAAVRIRYPGATSSWSFDIDGHSPDVH